MGLQIHKTRTRSPQREQITQNSTQNKNSPKSKNNTADVECDFFQDIEASQLRKMKEISLNSAVVEVQREAQNFTLSHRCGGSSPTLLPKILRFLSFQKFIKPLLFCLFLRQKIFPIRGNNKKQSNTCLSALTVQILESSDQSKVLFLYLILREQSTSEFQYHIYMFRLYMFLGVVVFSLFEQNNLVIWQQFELHASCGVFGFIQICCSG